jgi:hypothetical protein
MQIGALIALLRAVTLPFLASISAVFESRLARSLRAAVAIRAPICLTQTSEFLSLMNPLLTQMSGESASVEIQASARFGDIESRRRCRVGKIACVQEQPYAASMAILPTRKAKRVGTAREILRARNIWRGAPLPTLQIYSSGTRCSADVTTAALSPA